MNEINEAEVRATAEPLAASASSEASQQGKEKRAQKRKEKTKAKREAKKKRRAEVRETGASSSATVDINSSPTDASLLSPCVSCRPLGSLVHAARCCEVSDPFCSLWDGFGLGEELRRGLQRVGFDVRVPDQEIVTFPS